MDNMNIFTAKQRAADYNKCGVCKYYQYIGGECQRHAPIVGEQSHHILFPHVKKTDWCGDFEHELGVEVLKKELQEIKNQYSELITAVTKSTMQFPDESRHATILRYIKDVESRDYKSFIER